MRRVFVAGIGLTRIGEHWEKSLRTLFTEAALKAVDNAGVKLGDIEALYVSNMSSGYLQGQEHLGSLMATWLGIPGVAACKVEAACGSGGVAFHQAFLAIASGLYDCVLVGGVEKMTDTMTPEVTAALIMADDQEYVASIGATFVGLNALVYRLYMYKYGVRQEDIALFPVMCHRHAVNAPHAQYRREISVEAVLKSPVIADPIRLFESSPIGDGAAAAVLCSEEIAKRLGDDMLVEVVGSAVATDPLTIHLRDDPTTITATQKASRKAYRMAGIGPEKIDLVEVHDAFSILGVINLEDLGFAKKGEGWRLVKEGETEMDGKIPTNTMGGLKARGHPVGATGIYQICEVVMQLRDEAGANQVEGAEYGLAQNLGGVGSTVAINILRRVK